MCEVKLLPNNVQLTLPTVVADANDSPSRRFWKSSKQASYYLYKVIGTRVRALIRVRMSESQSCSSS